ncbi:hypothetical protein JHK87_049381 [Glycine soja]|nr:hypothetical protein JHK87_049381 [Glycine soja]
MASDVTVNSVSDLNNAPNPTKYVGPSSTPSLTASLLLPAATSTACGALTGSLFGYASSEKFVIWKHLQFYPELIVWLSAYWEDFEERMMDSPGTPQSLLQSCIAYGALSFIIEGLTKQRSALAYPMSKKTSVRNQGIIPTSH